MSNHPPERNINQSPTPFRPTVVGTDYTLPPGALTSVRGTATIPAGSTQLLHWIACSASQMSGGCNITWDKAYVGFTPPP